MKYTLTDNEPAFNYRPNQHPCPHCRQPVYDDALCDCTEALRDEVERLTAENERLREALGGCSNSRANLIQRLQDLEDEILQWKHRSVVREFAKGVKPI
jgi:hypothetical protein